MEDWIKRKVIKRLTCEQMAEILADQWPRKLIVDNEITGSKLMNMSWSEKEALQSTANKIQLSKFWQFVQSVQSNPTDFYHKLNGFHQIQEEVMQNESNFPIKITDVDFLDIRNTEILCPNVNKPGPRIEWAGSKDFNELSIDEGDKSGCGEQVEHFPDVPLYSNVKELIHPPVPKRPDLKIWTVSRDEGENILKQCVPGSFFFRKSNKFYCVLMVKMNKKKILNIPVMKEDSGVSLSTMTNKTIYFDNLSDLEVHYQMQHLIIEGEKVYLNNIFKKID